MKTKLLWLLIISTFNYTRSFRRNYTLDQVKRALQTKFYIHSKLNNSNTQNPGVNGFQKTITTLVNQVGIMEYPYISLQDTDDKAPSGYVGFLWNAITEYAGLKPEYIISCNKDAITEGKADIALVPEIMTSDTYDRFDLTHVVVRNWFNIYVQGKSLNSRIIYFRILSPLTVYALLGIWIASATVQWIILNTRTLTKTSSLGSSTLWFNKHQNLFRQAETNDFSLSTTLLSIYGLLLQQGSQIPSINKLAQFFSFMCGIFGMFIVTTYSSILISRITATQQYTNLKELVNDIQEGASSFSICLAEGSYAYKQLQADTNLEVGALTNWKDTMNRPPCSPTTNNMIPLKDFCREKVLIFEEQHHVNRHILRGKIHCKLLRDKTEYFEAFSSLAIRKNSPYKETINLMLIKMINTGIMDHAKSSWIPSLDTEHELPYKKENSITFVHIRCIIYAYFLAVIGSILVFIVELIVFHYKTILLLWDNECHCIRKMK